MDKITWQRHWGFTDDDMLNIDGHLIYFNGTITNIFDYGWDKWLELRRKNKVFIS